MPRYNVQDPKTGLWACFSTIVDDFVSPWLKEESYQRWRVYEYGRHCGDIRSANLMSLEEALKRKEIAEQMEEE